MRARTAVAVALLAVVQLLLVGVAVAPRLSAYALGEEYLLRVEPVDPIDPFRGAYVALSYPGVPQGEVREGTVYLPLVTDGAVAEIGHPMRTRPTHAPYLACESDGWGLTCGIESLFASQDEAKRLEGLVAGGGAVATVRVDDRGHAMVTGISAAPRS